MVDIVIKEKCKGLINVLEDDFSIHNSTTNNDYFGGKGKGKVKAKLSQIISNESPNLLSIFKSVETVHVSVKPCSYRSISHETLKTIAMKWAHSLEKWVLIWVPFDSVLSYRFT